jgi:glutamyl-tRNA reductase
MMLLTAGVSHKTAPLAVLERLAVQDSELVAVARSLKPHLDLDELVLLSSCNRVEIHGTTRRAITDGKSLSRLLCSETEDLTPHVCLYKGVAAARHLLRVTASLDSIWCSARPRSPAKLRMRDEIARAGGLTGRVLNYFFQKASFRGLHMSSING